MEPSFEPQTSKFPHKPHLCRPRGDVPGDATRYMICFVSYDLNIPSDPGSCTNSSHAITTHRPHRAECSSTSPADVHPLHRHLAHGPVILGPAAWLRLKPLRDGPMVEVSQVAFRNKRHRRPLFHVLFRQTIGQKGTVQTKDQVWSARRQLKAVATMSLISRGGR